MDLNSDQPNDIGNSVKRVVAIILCLWFALPVSAATYYASATGSGTTCSSGSKCQPEYAVNTKAAPGDTVLLSGGTYTMKLIFTGDGTLGNPITIKSAPGEWAKIDGYVHTTLGADITSHAAFATITIVTAADVGLKEGAQVWVGTELFRMGGKQGDGVTWNNCQGGWGGTTVATHTSGAALYNSDQTITIDGGSYLNFQDIEVLDSYQTRAYDFNFFDTTIPIRSGGFICLNSTGAKLINAVIHDTSTGVYNNESCVGLEIYGTIVYNNGFVDWSRGHGQGFYSANDPGVQKKIRNSISFNGFSDNAKTYSSSGNAKNMLYEHFIGFNAGVQSTFTGNHAGNNGAGGVDLPSTYRDAALFVGSNGDQKTDDIKIHSSYFYQPPNTSGPLLWAGYFSDVGATGFELIDSRIMGSASPLTVAYKTLTVTGNKFYAQAPSPASTDKKLVDARLDSNYTATWDDNDYYDQTPSYPFPATPFPFIFGVGGTLKSACAPGGNVLLYTDVCGGGAGGWKEVSGFDDNGSYTYAAPTGTEAFPIPNEYDSNRAHLAAYNWGSSSSISVSVAGVFNNGDTIQIWAVEEGQWPTGTPTATVNVSGNAISVPMDGTTVMPAIGNTVSMASMVPETTRPLFGAFILYRTAQGAASASSRMSGTIKLSGNVKIR